MTYNEILPLAQEVREALAPFCERIEIAGSIRRVRHLCKDIEIVCIRRPDVMSTAAFCETVNRWSKIKGDPLKDKYFQRKHPEGVNIDIFTATPDNWGLIFAIRTGSADFSHKVLARGWVRKGYRSQGGTLYKDGVAVPVPDEDALFAIIGTAFVPPEKREV